MPKAVILAGGLGTRLSEETMLRPKPMVEIGGKPLLWHVMKIYASYGVTDFVICCGFKGYVIKKYFANYFLHMSDVTFDMAKNSMEVHQRNAEPWKVTLVDAVSMTHTRPVGGGDIYQGQVNSGTADLARLRELYPDARINSRSQRDNLSIYGGVRTSSFCAGFLARIRARYATYLAKRAVKRIPKYGV